MLGNMWKTTTTKKTTAIISLVYKPSYVWSIIQSDQIHDDVIKWKHFPRNWPFVREIHRSPVNFPHKGQWRGALMFSLIYAWINDWVNNREAGDLRRQHGHYDVIVMQRKHTPKTRVTGLCEGNWPVNSLNSGPVTQKMFPFDDVIMEPVLNRHFGVASVGHVLALKVWT